MGKSLFASFLSFLRVRENILFQVMPVIPKAKGGAPTKRNSLALKRILKTAESGLPLHFCAQAGNITSETLLRWRKQDPQFDQLLQTARLKAVEQRWKRIEKAAKGTAQHPPDWKADAWSLERTYPQFFGRPDLQLSVNQSVSTGPTNVVVLGPERARVLATRYQQIRARTIALLEKFDKRDDAVSEHNTGNGGEQTEPPLLPYPGAKEKSVDRSSNGAIHEVGGLSDAVAPPP